MAFNLLMVLEKNKIKELELVITSFFLFFLSLWYMLGISCGFFIKKIYQSFLLGNAFWVGHFGNKCPLGSVLGKCLLYIYISSQVLPHFFLCNMFPTSYKKWPQTNKTKKPTRTNHQSQSKQKKEKKKDKEKKSVW